MVSLFLPNSSLLSTFSGQFYLLFHNTLFPLPSYSRNCGYKRGKGRGKNERSKMRGRGRYFEGGNWKEVRLVFIYFLSLSLALSLSHPYHVSSNPILNTKVVGWLGVLRLPPSLPSFTSLPEYVPLFLCLTPCPFSFLILSFSLPSFLSVSLSHTSYLPFYNSLVCFSFCQSCFLPLSLSLFFSLFFSLSSIFQKITCGTFKVSLNTILYTIHPTQMLMLALLLVPDSSEFKQNSKKKFVHRK
uniref:Uncharacterized protein n=1 Tax=Cacopsylla melanoneura TaxID=428564 RepID=A0A8D8W2Y4_9HEMI